MPLSGIVIRVSAELSPAALRARVAQVPGLQLGAESRAALAGVIDAPDYAAHDAALTALSQLDGVCAVDVVFHDFSDVTEFDRLPRRQRSSR